LIENYSKQLLLFIEQSPEWAFFIVLLIAFLESVAIVGVLMPGWLLLLGVGALIGNQVLPFYSMALAMFIGAVIGEGVSYQLGYHFRDNIRHWKWLESHQKGLERSDRFIKHYGVMSLIIGRFIGPLRALLPLVAGISGMSNRVFWLVNIGSGLLWAPIYLLPGILVGATFSLPEGTREVMAVFVFGECIFLWLSRRWWIAAKRLAKQSEDARGKKLQSILAMTCALLILIILGLSPLGQEILSILYKVFNKVG
jgi:membrane protein DedA with SNARE-associated domain